MKASSTALKGQAGKKERIWIGFSCFFYPLLFPLSLFLEQRSNRKLVGNQTRKRKEKRTFQTSLSPARLERERGSRAEELSRLSGEGREKRAEEDAEEDEKEKKLGRKEKEFKQRLLAFFFLPKKVSEFFFFFAHACSTLFLDPCSLAFLLLLLLRSQTCGEHPRAGSFTPML
jgi:hypothetical protein